MSDEELATEQEKQEVLAKLKAFLDQIEELEAKWRDLPEEQKLALPELAKFFGTYDAEPCNPALRSCHSAFSVVVTRLGISAYRD